MAELTLRLVRGKNPINPPTYVGQNQSRPSLNFQTDVDTGWRMQGNREFEWEIDGHRNTYRSNRQGFRSDRDFDHPSGMLIGAVGDSFTWGSGVEYGETFGHLIESNLAGATVYNFAMPGFGIDQMWMSIRHQILPLHRLWLWWRSLTMIWGAASWRIVSWKASTSPGFILSNGQLRLQTSADVPSRRFVALASHSQLWIATMRTISRLWESWALNTAILEGSKGFSFIDIPSRQHLPKDIHFERDGHINAKGHSLVAEAITDWIKQSNTSLR